MTVIGVTGTDGKTTTTNLLYEILKAAGYRAGMISTVGAVAADQAYDTGFHVTTPEAPDVQRYLAWMHQRGITHVVLEATSHGLEQQRVTACEFDIAVFTNITHEHLDYHHTYQAYQAAKAHLLEQLGQTILKASGNFRKAILNRDDGSYDYLAKTVERMNRNTRQDMDGDIQIISYGLINQAEVMASNIMYQNAGMHFLAKGKHWELPVITHLLGDYNISNCLAAIAAAVDGLGLDPQLTAAGIGKLTGIPGRMEAIDMGQNFTAIVDFAHTPNALRNVLMVARRLADSPGTNRVIAIFGSAGLRDQKKRRMMAEISLELADVSIFTAEDPRSESLESILSEMADGAKGRGGQMSKNYFLEPDRPEAIRRGVKIARAGDVVLLLGKGHEQSMCFGSVEYYWDDRIAMRAALAAIAGIPGPLMPTLPTSTGE
jgi:UDP-N-acetylmuramoyl-L-alanyl-D-glutamate--2,6-diaminopimelate ligase